MKPLAAAALLAPLSAVAADYVEAVKVEQLTGLENTDPAWSPDGKRIAFASNRANAGFEAFDIYVANADDSDVTRVTFGDGIEGRGSWTKPSFSADGKRISAGRLINTPPRTTARQ